MPLIQWYNLNNPIAIWNRSSTNATSNTGLNLLINTPDGVLQNDVLVATIFFGSDVNSSIPVVTPPAGWVPVTQANHGTAASLIIYYLVAGGAEPSNYTWSFTATSDANPTLMGSISAYVNVNTSAPIDVSSSVEYPGAAAFYATPTVTTTSTQGNMLVLSWAGSQ